MAFKSRDLQSHQNQKRLAACTWYLQVEVGVLITLTTTQPYNVSQGRRLWIFWLAHFEARHPVDYFLEQCRLPSNPPHEHAHSELPSFRKKKQAELLAKQPVVQTRTLGNFICNMLPQ